MRFWFFWSLFQLEYCSSLRTFGSADFYCLINFCFFFIPWYIYCVWVILFFWSLALIQINACVANSHAPVMLAWTWEFDVGVFFGGTLLSVHSRLGTLRLGTKGTPTWNWESVFLQNFIDKGLLWHAVGIWGRRWCAWLALPFESVDQWLS